MRKYTTQQHKLCKLLQSFSDQPSRGNFPEVEFDDKVISKTPLTILTSRFKVIQQEEKNRKDVIKNKIKDELRNQMSQPSSNIYLKFVNEDQQMSTNKREIYSPPMKVNSEIIRVRKFPVLQKKKQRQSPLLLSSPYTPFQSYIERTHLFKQKSMDIRKRVIHTSRTPARSNNFSLQRKVTKKSTVCIMKDTNPEMHFEDLEPWRYPEEIQIEEPLFMRKRLAIK